MNQRAAQRGRPPNCQLGDSDTMQLTYRGSNFSVPNFDVKTVSNSTAGRFRGNSHTTRVAIGLPKMSRQKPRFFGRLAH